MNTFFERSDIPLEISALNSARMSLEERTRAKRVGLSHLELDVVMPTVLMPTWS